MIDGMDSAIITVCISIALSIYLLPTIIAGIRRHADINAIAALNILLGWLLVGWIAAFIWSLTGNVRTAHHAHSRMDMFV